MPSGNKTTSIPRPSGSGRGGTTTTNRRTTSVSSTPTQRHGDFTRPIPVDARLIQRDRSRLVLGAIAVVIVLALAGALLVLPLRAWLNQRDDLAERRSELAALDQANARLEDEVARLQTPEGIEDAAREELGFVEAGEERVSVVEVPTASAALPPGFPYGLVQQIIAARNVVPVEPTPTPSG